MWEFGLDVALVDATNRWNVTVESGSADNNVWVLVLVVFVGGLHESGVIGDVYTLLSSCSLCVCAEIAPFFLLALLLAPRISTVLHCCFSTAAYSAVLAIFTCVGLIAW